MQLLVGKHMKNEEETKTNIVTEQLDRKQLDPVQRRQLLWFSFFKGLGQYFLCMPTWFLNFPAALWRKIIINFLLASLKTVTYSEDCYKSRISVSVLAFLRCHWSIFFSVHHKIIKRKNGKQR
jgi:hypothetical protein